MRRAVWAALLLSLAALGAQAQTKKELAQKIVALQADDIGLLARNLVEQTVAPMLPQIGPALNARVPAERRQAVSDEMLAIVKKYIDETQVLLRERALKLAPDVVGAQLEEKFSDDELKQLVALLESPVNRKYRQLGGDINRAFVDKLVADTRPLVEPKLKALDEALVARLNAASTPAAPPGSASGVAPGAASGAASTAARPRLPASPASAASSAARKP